MIEPRSVSRLLPVPVPPHDPYSVWLSGSVGPEPTRGWRTQHHDRVEIDLTTRALALGPSPAAARWLTEETGSFGGLRVPAHVAVGASGDVLLLDREQGTLLRFDPCECRFVRLPCLTRPVPAPTGCEDRAGLDRLRGRPLTELLDPRSIAICAGRLFVADRGHGRLVVIELDGLVPTRALALPPKQRVTLPDRTWHPTGLAVDGHGTLFVSDPEHGRIDRFDARGRWAGFVDAGHGVTHLAVDCQDRVFAVVAADLPSATVSIGPGPATLEFDSGRDAFHWYGLRSGGVPASPRFAMDLHSGDQPWSSAHRDDPQNQEWSAWLQPDDVSSLRECRVLSGTAGRYLRLRFRPVPAAAASAVTLDFSARGARLVRVEGDAVVDETGTRADRAEGFPRAPIHVDAQGRLHLHCDCGPEIFDDRGRRWTPDQRSREERFERAGTFRTSAIDSAIEGCQWHRIELRGAIPEACSVEVRTTTAVIELTQEEIGDLPESAWCTRAMATTMTPRERATPESCAWDCLILSPPGRYLWVELRFAGDGRGTPCIASALIEYPRISLRRYLPAVFGADPVAADFTDRLTAIFDATLRSIEGRLDRLAMLFDPDSAPAVATRGNTDFLSWIAGWVGIVVARDWPEARRRRFVKEAARLFCLRGTPGGLRRQLLLLLGFDRAYQEHCLAERPQTRCIPLPRNCAPCPPCLPASPPPLILEHFKLRRWLFAGHGRLGDESVLWGKRLVGRSELSGTDRPPSGNAQIGVTTLNQVPDPLRDPFLLMANRFSVFVPARVRDDPDERRALEQLLARETPAHAQADVRYVEPRFRVGVQAMIGLDSVIARTPCGVTLEATRLRQGSVLTGRHSSPPTLEVGNARVGSTTVLT